MATRRENVESLAKRLAANARFKLDYNAYRKSQRKLLIVEGGTDRTFLEKIQGEQVDCVVASTVFKSNEPFHAAAPAKVNYKDAIVTLITSISFYPSPLVTYPDELDKWDLYGMVDRDCDELQLSRPSPRLFITDTHDLETLLLSSDDGLLCRLDGCDISKEEVDRAYDLAYQLSFFRQELFAGAGEPLNLTAISCSTCQVDFSTLIVGDKVDLTGLLAYLSVRSSPPPSESKLKKIFQQITGGKAGKKRLDKDGHWKGAAASPASADDFWIAVNGHDILQLLKYINQTVMTRFQDENTSRLNRIFELCLIENYDYTQFSKTALAQQMQTAGLLREM